MFGAVEFIEFKGLVIDGHESKQTKKRKPSSIKDCYNAASLIVWNVFNLAELG